MPKQLNENLIQLYKSRKNSMKKSFWTSQKIYETLMVILIIILTKPVLSQSLNCKCQQQTKLSQTRKFHKGFMQPFFLFLQIIYFYHYIFQKFKKSHFSCHQYLFRKSSGLFCHLHL